jgi:DNA polymerase I-like protein with 3'-5' exonuclease and polymerase domains
MIDPELALKIVRESPIMAFDTETTGLTVTDKVVGWVVTDKSHSLYVPVRHEGGGNIPNAEEWEKSLAVAFLERGRLGFTTVGHNLGFDLRISLRCNVSVPAPVEDTMVNEALLNDLTVGYGLDKCAERRGLPAKKGAAMYAELARRFGGLPDQKAMKNFWRMPGDDPTVVEYATGDGITTLALWEAQQPLLDEMGLRKVHKLECDLIPYLARMHHRGLRVDGEYASRVRDEINVAIKEKLSVFSAGFNARSGKEVEALYRANGYDDTMFNHTDKGAASFTESWLETNEIGEAILSVRRLEKARDSFMSPLIDTHNVNGRVHPILNQSKSDDYGVAGARLSCSDPNLQAFPKRNMDVGRVVRRLIVPDEGLLLEEADARQQEPRLFTHYSEDAALLHGYRTGEFDIHDRANEVLGLHDRDRAKRLGMGMLTMMSAKTLANHMRCEIKEAEVLHGKFLHDAFPSIREFQNTAVSKFRKLGYVRSILGRIAHCDSPKFGYRAVSRIIQNSGGDHIKTCMLRANQYEDAYPDRIQMLLSIHDSMMWQRDPGHPNTELVKALEHVANEFDLLVPIPFDVGSGSDWARASYGKKLDRYEATLDSGVAA